MLTKFKRSCTVQIKSNRLMSCLSLSTMTILTIASIVLITIINVTPVVILGLAELKQGQRDLIILPKEKYFNTSLISQLANVPVMPRIDTQVLLKPSTRAKGWFMDFKMQREQRLGSIAGDQQPNHRYIYAHQSLGFKPQQEVQIVLIDKSILAAILTFISLNQRNIPNANKISQQLQQLVYNSQGITGKFIVKRCFDSSQGKFGIGNVNNYVYMDIKYAFTQMVQNSLNKTAQESPLVQFLGNSFNLGDFATEATINLPDRVAVYVNPDYEQTYANLQHYGQQVVSKIGLFAVDTQMPIAQNLVPLGFVGMFIGVMLKLIIFSLFILSVIMMNNMLLMGVQRKNFDFALMKVMGADRLFIVINLLTSSLKYVLLANFIAYPLAYISLQAVTTVFEGFFGYRYQIVPTFYAILGGIIIGVLVPVVSAVLPIWDVIKNDLAQNLNPVRNKTQSIKTEVYIEGREFPLGKFSFGVLAAVYGIMIYYLLPRALINQSLGLLLVVFFIILQGFLVGLILMSYSCQFLFEKLVARLTLFWVDKTDFVLMQKNLSAHRFKNRRSSILYALSVSFIIFVSVGLSIQVQTIYNQILKWRGSYVQIRSNAGTVDRFYYNELLSKTQGVQDWAFITQSLNNYMARHMGVQKIMISDRARLFFANNQIFGVTPNLINTFFYDRVSVYKTQAQPPYDPYSYLYSPQGDHTCTISKYIAKNFGILQGSSRQFFINFYTSNSVRRVPLNYTSVFDKRIGLLYSGIGSRSQVGVSFDTFRSLAGLASDDQVPVQFIKVKVNPAQAKQVANRIRASNMGLDTVWDYSQLQTTILKIQNILVNIQNILLVVVLLISFFSLVTTTYVNVLNQTNQIAILMVLGYSKMRIAKIYIYQCFVLVLNSCLIGLIVGYTVAWLMSLQRQVFSDLPVEVEVPGIPIIMIVAIVSSILATIKPLRQIFGKSISQIMNFAK